MKLVFTFIHIIIFAAFVNAQSSTFNLLDSNVTAGQEFTTRQIYFELGKATLKPESNVILDSIVTFLNSNKKIKVEIQVHSDSRINPNCCSKPTEHRAKSISEYLSRHGISDDRITAKGYGDVKPIFTDQQINKAPSKTEQEAMHAINRRVIVKVTP